MQDIVGARVSLDGRATKVQLAPHLMWVACNSGSVEVAPRVRRSSRHSFSIQNAQCYLIRLAVVLHWVQLALHLMQTRSSRHVPWEGGTGDRGSRHGLSSNVQPNVHLTGGSARCPTRPTQQFAVAEHASADAQPGHAAPNQLVPVPLLKFRCTHGILQTLWPCPLPWSIRRGSPSCIRRSAGWDGPRPTATPCRAQAGRRRMRAV